MPLVKCWYENSDYPRKSDRQTSPEMFIPFCNRDHEVVLAGVGVLVTTVSHMRTQGK